MNSALSEIEKSAQQLSALDREQLARRLFESVHGKELTDVDEAWLAVAEERLNAYNRGQDRGMTETDFFNRVQSDLGWK
ncbi:MAG: addiction module protein [Opitutales bacterium]|nr:addiction module protein [Opitutales bacterium]